MKITALLNPEVTNILTTLMNVQLPLKGAFKLKRIQREVNSAIKDYHELRIASLTKYAELKEDGDIQSDDKGQAIFSDPLKEAIFYKELTKLQNTDIELSIKKLTLEDLGDNLIISATELLLLEDLIEV